MFKTYEEFIKESILEGWKSYDKPEDGFEQGEINSVKVKWNQAATDIYWLPKSKEIVADLPNYQLVATGTKSIADKVVSFIKGTKSEDEAVKGLKQDFKFLKESVDEELESILEAELSKLQQEYRDYFMATLEEFGVDSPAKLSDEKKREFFAAIKSGWVKGKGAKNKD